MKEKALLLQSLSLLIAGFINVSSTFNTTRVIFPTWPSSRNSAQFEIISQIIKDVVLGPFKEGITTMLFPREFGHKATDIGQLIRDVETPVCLLRMSEGFVGDVNDYLSNSSDTHKIPLKKQQYFDEEGDVVHLLSAGGNVVLVTSEDEDMWTPLWLPPDDWSVKAILVISSVPSCWSRLFLRSPLIQITPYVALICPSINGAGPSKAIIFKVWTWYPFASGRKLRDLGAWKPDSFVRFDQLFLERFRDMRTKTIRILANAIDRPFFYTRGNGESAGQTFQIVDAISQWLGYKTDFESGASVSYSTMQGLVKIGEKDLMINYATPTLERFADYQLTVPYASEGFGLLLEIPPPLPLWQNLLYPLSWQVWIGIVVSTGVTAATFHLLQMKRQKRKSFFDNAITITKSLLLNALDVVPEGWCVRSFLLVWWFGSWILALSYTCNLIAILTVPTFPTKIQTVRELAESKYRLCMVDYGEFVPEALATSTQPTFFALGAKMDMVPQRDDLPEMGEEACVERVLAGTHAHTEAYPYAATLYSMMNLDPKVYALEERLYPSYLVILVYKHAPWKHKFDIGMERLREAGLLKKWYEDAMNEFKGKATDESSRKAMKPLSLSHMQGPFYILVCGILIGLLAMGGEVLLPPSK